jgi:hypothetical protein
VNDRERFFACMNYRKVDHAPFWIWGPWPETLERWQKEGHRPGIDQPEQRADTYAIRTDWFYPYPRFENRVVSEDAETVLHVNEEGILMREMKHNRHSSMPQFVKFPVETRSEFRSFWRQRMQPDLSKRVGPDWEETLRGLCPQDKPFFVWADRWGGFFGPLRNLVGVERLCELFYDDPVFLEEMMDANADFIIALMSQVLDTVRVDSFWFWEDMAYKTAPLISPDLARRFMLPRYRRVVDFLKGRGVPFIALDSDGQVDSLIPIWLEAGINALFPFEVQAGMDVRAVRAKYGQTLRIFGGVDKRALARGPVAIDAELKSLKPLINEGGYVPHTDHSIPPNVSYGNYCYYIDKLEEICHV